MGACNSRQSIFAKRLHLGMRQRDVLSAITVNRTGTLLRRRQKVIKARSVAHFRPAV